MYRELVENELVMLVDALKANAPALKEVRVFGSYQNGNWNPSKSDIDIFVLIDDEHYSVDSGREPGYYCTYESKQRRELRKKIKEGLSEEYRKRFSLHLCSPNDIRRLIGVNEGKGDIGKDMKNGRLLYKGPESNPARLPE